VLPVRGPYFLNQEYFFPPQQVRQEVLETEPETTETRKKPKFISGGVVILGGSPNEPGPVFNLPTDYSAYPYPI